MPTSWLWELQDVSALPPVPLLFSDTIFQAWLVTLCGQAIQHDVSARLQVPTPVINDNGVWLPLLKRVLPNTWRTKGLASLAASKDDNSPVVFDLWNYRVLPLFPHLSPVFFGKFPILGSSPVVPASLSGVCLVLVDDLPLLVSTLAVPTRDIGTWTGGGSAAARLLTAQPCTGGVDFSLCPDFLTRGCPANLESLVETAQNVSLNPALWDYMIKNIWAGIQALAHFCSSTFWEWSNGSTLFFWRWPQEFCQAAQDGFPLQICGPLPNNLKVSRRCPWGLEEQIWSKLRRFLSCCYIRLVPTASVENVTEFFGIPKGTHDIHVVFNGTKSGLTDALWAPSFWLPNAPSMLRTLSFNHKLVDSDLGKFFINLPLHPYLRPYSAVDLTAFRSKI